VVMRGGGGRGTRWSPVAVRSRGEEPVASGKAGGFAGGTMIGKGSKFDAARVEWGKGEGSKGHNSKGRERGSKEGGAGRGTRKGLE